jgi:hypothetical protein
VVLAHQPPRQRGLEATDLALGGVHVGEPALADLAARSAAVAFVHAGLDDTAGQVAGATWEDRSRALRTLTWSDRLVVAAGPLEALPHERGVPRSADSCAIVVEIDHMRARVRRLAPATRNPGNLQ